MHYRLSKFNIFTRWLPTNQTAILMFDSKSHSDAPYPFSGFVEPDINMLSDPFWVYTQIMEEVAPLQESAIWAIRDQVRRIEMQQKPLGKPQPDYRGLHDIARHAIHVTETVAVNVQTLEHILRQHERNTIPNQPFETRQEVHSRLAFFQSYLSGLRDRTVSNEKRLQNEVQLAFNMVAQHDAGTTVEISRAARSDSATMKTIAFITLTFLPPTFICTLFSMSFFDFGAESGGWSVSSKIWIYWVIAIPITAATALLWYFWSMIFPYKSSGESGTQIEC
jgi:Mg2+ and Co2+ transporter CorA